MEKFKIFKEHHDRKTANTFFPRLYEEYFGLWLPTPTVAEVEGAEGDSAVALAKVRKAMENVRDFEFAE